MQKLTGYLAEYSKSHQNKRNIFIHSICVPAIMWSLLGMLMAASMAYGVVVLALIYYFFFKNPRVLLAMGLASLLMLYSFQFIPQLFLTSLVVFVIAWIGQFYGHKIEGKKPSFLQDLQFLLIGPVWVLFKIAPKFFGNTK